MGSPYSAIPTSFTRLLTSSISASVPSAWLVALFSSYHERETLSFFFNFFLFCVKNSSRQQSAGSHSYFREKLFRVLLSDCCLSCCQTSDRYTGRRAGYVIQANLVAELNRGGISTVLTTDTNMELRINRFSKFDSHLHQFANTSLIQFCKRIVLKDLGVIVSI